MSLFRRAWSAFGRLGIIIAIALAFIFGMTGTVYLSLRSPEVKVPNILGKDRQAAEDELSRAGLNMRVRATRYSSEVKPDSILLQLPFPDEVVKRGQTVAVDISRAQAKEGEVSTSVANQTEEKKQDSEENKEDGNQNEAQPGAANNQNANQNQNNRNRNKNRNANNANNSNNRNANNANNRNGNANRPTANANNRNAPVTANNSNRTGSNTNANRRPPVTTPPFNPGSNTRP